MHSPFDPDMLFINLLPESAEEMSLFGMGSDAEDVEFEVEAHIKRLALERKKRERFQQPKNSHDRGIWPFRHDLDESVVVANDIVHRITALDEARILLGDDGVKLILDEQGYSEL